MGAPPARTAVVVGAGVGGLAAAGGLATAGWRVTLLERADRLRAEPTALLLWPSGVRALSALDRGAGLAAIATPVPDGGLRRPDGRWLVAPQRGAPARPLLAHAEDLHDALVAGLGDRVEVRTSTAVRPAATAAAAGQRPAVTDGRQTWEADLLVAADGMDSTVRAAVTTAGRVVSAGVTAWRAVIPWYRAPELPAGPAASADPAEPAEPAGPAGPAVTQAGGHRFRFAALGERSGTGTSGRGGLYWSATVPGGPRPEPAATQLELLRRWFAGWHAPIPELLAATDPGDVVQRELQALRPPPARLAAPVGDGAVVLLGDAGHGLADHLGQGACLAVEDAATLVAALRADTPLHTAVAGYDRARRSRLARVRRTSRRLAAGGVGSRFAAVQARRRARAAETAAGWHPPA